MGSNGRVASFGVLMAMMAVLIFAISAGAELEKKKNKEANNKPASTEQPNANAANNSNVKPLPPDSNKHSPAKFDTFIDRNKDGIDDRVKRPPVVSKPKRPQVPPVNKPASPKPQKVKDEHKQSKH